MSRLLCKKREKIREAAPWQRDGSVRCALCRGELYPGDLYFALEGRRVCEACLERYARRFFAHRLRRLGAGREWAHED